MSHKKYENMITQSGSISDTQIKKAVELIVAQEFSQTHLTTNNKSSGVLMIVTTEFKQHNKTECVSILLKT